MSSHHPSPSPPGGPILPEVPLPPSDMRSHDPRPTRGVISRYTCDGRNQELLLFPLQPSPPPRTVSGRWREEVSETLTEICKVFLPLGEAARAGPSQARGWQWPRSSAMCGREGPAPRWQCCL